MIVKDLIELLKKYRDTDIVYTTDSAGNKLSPVDDVFAQSTEWNDQDHIVIY